MKKLFVLLLSILPVVAFCADKKMQPGKWKEVSRMPAGQGSISFTDTIHIEFLIGNEYIWQKQNSFIFRGTYKLNDKDLDMGSRFFTIIDRKPNRLVLKDESGTYEFVPDHSVPAPIGTVAPMEHYNTVTDINQMVGHWSVFKSTSAKQMSSIDYTRKIKIINITGGSGSLGSVFSTHDADTAPSWTITGFSNQMLTCTGKDNRTLKVLKCEGGELVVEEGDMTYFFKQFK